MKKAQYTAPELRILAAETESDMLVISYRNASDTYFNKETDMGEVIEKDLPDGVEVGSKDNNGWTFDVWE